MGGKLALIVCFYTVLIGFALHVFYWTPTALPADAHPKVFSEARARQHVSVLTERIGVRSVSSSPQLPIKTCCAVCLLASVRCACVAGRLSLHNPDC